MKKIAILLLSIFLDEKNLTQPNTSPDLAQNLLSDQLSTSTLVQVTINLTYKCPSPHMMTD